MCPTATARDAIAVVDRDVRVRGLQGPLPSLRASAEQRCLHMPEASCTREDDCASTVTASVADAATSAAEKGGSWWQVRALLSWDLCSDPRRAFESSETEVRPLQSSAEGASEASVTSSDDVEDATPPPPAGLVGSWRLFLQSLSEGHVNMAYWTNDILCATVHEISEEEFQAKRAYIKGVDTDHALTIAGSVRYIRRRPDRLSHVLSGSESRRIDAYVECRTKMMDAQPRDWMFYHAFMLLEVGGGFMLCTEKYNHSLESMFGEQELVQAFASHYRATGQPRRIAARRCARKVLPSEGSAPTVGNLMDWIDGPCAKKYQPYDLFRMNCQHYSEDLMRFLEAPTLEVGWRSLGRGQVLAAVRREGLELSRAPEALRGDREVVLIAIANSEAGLALQHASDALRGDRSFALEAVRARGLCLQFCSEGLRADPEVVLAAVEQDGMSLAYASDALRADRRVVIRAVHQNGLALQHASSALRRDRLVGMTAVASAPQATELLLPPLEEKTAAAVGKNPPHANQGRTQLDRKVSDIAVDATNVTVVLNAKVICRGNGNKLLLIASKPNGKQLCTLGFSAQNESDVLGARLANRLQCTLEDIILLRPDGEELDARLGLGEAWVALQDGRREALLAAVRGGLGFGLIPEDFTADHEVVLAAVSLDGEALRHASPALQADHQVVFAAVEQSGRALRHAAPELRANPILALEAAKRGYDAGWL